MQTGLLRHLSNGGRRPPLHSRLSSIAQPKMSPTMLLYQSINSW